MRAETARAPYLSVVICTLNRAPILRGALESFYAMAGAGDPDVELWIVDNGSRDETAVVVEEIASRESNLHYRFEGRVGLAHARNTGIRVARGAVVAFVDDDVMFDPEWLAAVRRAVHEHPEAAAFGGRTVPRFEVPRPAWISDDLLHFFGSTRSGDRLRVMVYPECPFGLNMAFRREALRQVGEFNAALGRRGDKLLSNDETEYFQRVARANLSVLYVPDALLFHRIPLVRTTRQWLASRQYWQGISDAALTQIERPRSRAGLVTRAAGDAWQVFADLWARRLSRTRNGRVVLTSPAAVGFRLANRIGRIHGSLRQALRPLGLAATFPSSPGRRGDLGHGRQKSGVTHRSAG